MKKINILMLIGISLFFIALGLWLNTFYSSHISTKSTEWSNFGSYIGGVTGPILSFISILLVLRTIKLTQRNHSEQIKLINQEQTYAKFTDLCFFLENAVKESWIATNNPRSHALLSYIKESITEHPRFEKSIDNLSSIVAISLEVTTKALQTYLDPIDNIVVIIRSMNKFIFNDSNHDRDLMTSLVELKFTNEQRYLIFHIMKRDYPEDADTLTKNWPTFWVFPWKTEHETNAINYH